MAFLELPINSLEQSVTKPIIIQVLNHIYEEIFYSNGTEMLFVDHTGTTHPIGSTLSNSGENSLRLDNSSKVIARSVERHNSDILFTNVVKPSELDVLWADQNLNMYLKPVRNRSDFEVSLTYKASTRQEALNFINQYHNKLIKGVSFVKLGVNYEYLVSNHIIAFMNEVHRVRESSHGYGESFIKYLTDNMLTTYEFKRNVNSKTTSLAIQEHLKGITVLVDSEVPEISPIDVGGYEAALNLKFVLDKPTHLILEYPIFVHGNYLDGKYFNHQLNVNDKASTTLDKATRPLFNTLTELYRRERSSVLSESGYSYPPFDDIKLDNKRAQLIPIVKVQLAIDPDDPRLVLDLSKLEADLGITLHPELLYYMRSEPIAIFKYFESIINVSIYRDGVRLNPDKYYLDENMQVRSNYDMNIRGSYHVTVNILYPVHRLSERSVKALSKYGDLAIALMQFLDHSLTDADLPVKYGSGGVIGSTDSAVNPVDLRRTIDKIAYVPKGVDTGRFLVNTIIVNNAN